MIKRPLHSRAKGVVFTYFLLLYCLSQTLYSQHESDPLPVDENKEEIYKVVEIMPRFPGCEDLDLPEKEKQKCAKEKMLEYIYKNLKYPETAKSKRIEGMSVIQFVVANDGFIDSIKIVRNPGGGTGEEAMRVVRSMNEMSERWVAGRQRGKPVKVQYTLPIKFKLEDRHKRYSSNPYKSNEAFFYSETDKKPRLSECENYKSEECTSILLKEFVEENMIYPEKALKKKLSDKVSVQFIIERDGSVSNVRVTDSQYSIFHSDAKEIIEWMNEADMTWTPAKIEGYKVRCITSFEIVYDYKSWVDNN